MLLYFAAVFYPSVNHGTELYKVFTDYFEL